MNSTRGSIWGGLAALAAATLIAGCTPTPISTPTPTPSPVTTPTPTPVSSPTMSANQMAATDAVLGFSEAMSRIARFEPGVDPNQIHTYARGDATTMAIKYFNDLAGRRLKERGESVILTSVPSEETVQDGRPTIVVSTCIDDRQLQIVDESGKDVMGEESKTVASTDFTVQHWTDDGWFVTERTEGTGQCDS